MYQIVYDHNKAEQRLTEILVAEQVKVGTTAPVLNLNTVGGPLKGARSQYLNAQEITFGDKLQYNAIVIYPTDPAKEAITLFDDSTPMDLVVAAKQSLRTAMLRALHDSVYNVKS